MTIDRRRLPRPAGTAGLGTGIRAGSILAAIPAFILLRKQLVPGPTARAVKP